MIKHYKHTTGFIKYNDNKNITWIYKIVYKMMDVSQTYHMDLHRLQMYHKLLYQTPGLDMVDRTDWLVDCHMTFFSQSYLFRRLQNMSSMVAMSSNFHQLGTKK